MPKLRTAEPEGNRGEGQSARCKITRVDELFENRTRLQSPPPCCCDRVNRKRRCASAEKAEPLSPAKGFNGISVWKAFRGTASSQWSQGAARS